LMGTSRDPAALGVPLASFHQRQNIIFDMLDRVGPGVILRVYPHRRLCDARRCAVYADRSILYRDDSHLSVAGASYVQSELEPIFTVRSHRGTKSCLAE
jgi:hypothetical protein